MRNPTPVPAAKKPRLTWVRKAADRVPTKWFATILAAAFLAATAAFGSLADAPVAEPPKVEAETPVASDYVSLALQRAVLIDDFPEMGVSVGEGERVLVVVATVENLWDRPLSGSGAAIRDALRVNPLSSDAEIASVALLDDGATSPSLNPGIPVEVAIGWTVPAALDLGDSLDVTISEVVPYPGFSVIPEFSFRWDREDTLAVVTLPLTDVGAGARDE